MYVNKFRNLSKECINYANKRGFFNFRKKIYTYDLLIFNDTNSMKKTITAKTHGLHS